MKKIEPYFGVVMMGGILGGYAVAGFHGMFASAQTANLIALVELLVGKNMIDAAYRVGSLLVFIAGIAGSEYIKLKKPWNVEKIAVVIDMAVAFWMAFGPLSENTVCALYPIWFAAAFQWNVFEGTEGYKSSCVFSTNNLKQFVLSWIRYFIQGEEKEKQRAAHFGKVLVCFHVGVVAACLCYPLLGRWTVLLLLLLGLEAYWCLCGENEPEGELLQEEMQ